MYISCGFSNAHGAQYTRSRLGCPDGKSCDEFSTYFNQGTRRDPGEGQLLARANHGLFITEVLTTRMLGREASAQVELRGDAQSWDLRLELVKARARPGAECPPRCVGDASEH